jgi:lipoyl(octanoyl) transferase
METSVLIRHLEGLQDYESCWQGMKQFTDLRTPDTEDEIWVTEHSPVFTQGQNGKPEHVLDAGTIPIIKTDRGGQVTYHGPGQIMLYTLIDVKRKKWHVRQLVSHLENAVLQFLAARNIQAEARCDAPGIYVNNKKLASVGLRIRRGAAYHGLAVNLAMDLAPFSRINPCGLTGMQMTQLKDLDPSLSFNDAKTQLIEYLVTNLGYTTCNQAHPF